MFLRTFRVDELGPGFFVPAGRSCPWPALRCVPAAPPVEAQVLAHLLGPRSATLSCTCALKHRMESSSRTVNLESRPARRWGLHIFIFARSCQTPLPRGCTHFHSHQHVRLPRAHISGFHVLKVLSILLPPSASPQPCQYSSRLKGEHPLLQLSSPKPNPSTTTFILHLSPLLTPPPTTTHQPSHSPNTLLTPSHCLSFRPQQSQGAAGPHLPPGSLSRPTLS